MRILVLHGPNLNLLGRREPELYGLVDLATIDAMLQRAGQRLGIAVDCVQSNHEGQLIDAIQSAIGRCDGIVINPGGLSHSSVSLRDALAAGPPALEVHLSNIHAREPFRQRSLTAGACLGGVYGLGAAGYVLALEGLVARLRDAGKA
ncbi:MAG: type II 3-dehydroquinate dehydratase [Caldilineae bacterium]|nr:type II 3-dehydroquinate dehydratase [Chloroflexota bacterium]MCB9176330.1 type II 3-dehydroquinate dehydratase [Caldilineae bacterium]